MEADTEASSNEPKKVSIIVSNKTGQEDQRAATSATFSILQEDHTLGNALRYMIMRNSKVDFCGYSIPHPSEEKLHMRIQTEEGYSAVEAMEEGLDSLINMCLHIQETFETAYNAGEFERA